MVAGGPRLGMARGGARAAIPSRCTACRSRSRARASPMPRTCSGWQRSARRIEPALISEHLAWSAWNGHYFPDLLPFAAHHRGPAPHRGEHRPRAGRARPPRSRSRTPPTTCASTATPGTRSTSSPSWRAAPAARCCWTSTTSMCRRATSATRPRPGSTAFPPALVMRSPSRRPFARPGAGRGPADRLARCAGRAGGLGALPPLHRARRRAADADRARRQRAGLRRADGTSAAWPKPRCATRRRQTPMSTPGMASRTPSPRPCFAPDDGDRRRPCGSSPRSPPSRSTATR